MLKEEKYSREVDIKFSLKASTVGGDGNLDFV